MAKRVVIHGDHPWAGHRGQVVEGDKPGPFGMMKVRIDCNDAMDGHECYVGRENMLPDPTTCERCGMAKAHYRTKGYRCQTCD